MAQQTVSLAPGESRVVSFEATPKEARIYQVSVNGLTGSFKAISAVPADKIVDFPDLQILNVEGITFNKVAIETFPNVDVLVELLKAYSVPPGTPYVEQPEGFKPEHLRDAANFILPTVLSTPLDAPYPTQIAHIMPAVAAIADRHPDWLYPIGIAPYSVASYIAQGVANVIGEPIPTAYLSQPIEMPAIRGISVTAIGKTNGLTEGDFVSGKPGLNLNLYGLGYTVMGDIYLYYEPTFTAPMPPPACRGGGIIQCQLTWHTNGARYPVTFQYLPSTLSATGVFSGGYYYPGIYNGRLAVGWKAGPYSGAYNYFRIKNLAKVTGEGHT